jgi:hypothetical protein
MKKNEIPDENQNQEPDEQFPRLREQDSNDEPKDKESEWAITMSMPLQAKGWRVTVKVVDAEGNLLVTDEGNLMSLPNRTKMVNRLTEELKLDESNN